MQEALIIFFSIVSPLTYLAYTYPNKYEQIIWPATAVLFILISFCFGWMFGQINDGIGMPWWILLIFVFAFPYVLLLPRFIAFIKDDG